MRASDVEYHAPARFDDLIEAFVRVSRIGRSSMTYECAAYRLPGRHAHGHGAADARARRRRYAAARRRCRTSSGRQFEHSRAAISRNEPRLGGSGSADRHRRRRSGRHPPRKRRSTDGAGRCRMGGHRLPRRRRARSRADSRDGRRIETNTTPILFQGALVGELWVDGGRERAELERIAALVAPYVLIGWDTDGETWDP